MGEPVRVKAVPEDQDLARYRQGDIGQPLKGINNNRWILCCPLCGTTTAYPEETIEKHADGTVSTKQPLHCHGRDARRQFRIEHNEVRLVDG